VTKTSRWLWVVSLVATLGTGLVLAFLLAVATNNRDFYERHYVWLFAVNVAVAALLVLVIAITAIRLWVRVLRGRFGSRLLLKLAAIFALVAVVPGVLIYTVSYQFVSRSIESWFDVKVEGALDAGLNLGRSTLDAQVEELARKTRLEAERLAETRGPVQPLQLERVREQLAVQGIAVVGSTGQVLLSMDAGGMTLTQDRPAASLLRQARTSRVASQIEGLEDDASIAAAAATGASSPAAPRIRALAYLPTTSVDLRQQDRFLYVTQFVPQSIAVNALAVQAAYREYQQRSLARAGLRQMYIGTLTLALVLAVFGALLLAVMLANQLARPLLLLAEGMKQVAQGDLSAKQVFASRDELGGLTRSFADMTEQLSDARALVQRSVAQVEGARTNLQTILDNLTAGVIVFDRHGLIDTVNPGATRILRLPLSIYRGRALSEVATLEAFGVSVQQRFETLATHPEAGERDQWQDSFELQSTTQPIQHLDGPERDTLTLLVRGARMPNGATLIVFDDITEVVSAQRSQAWSEVARRLAHEIKNPLTPIQLSAERLQHKLETKLEGADQAMLVRAVATIVNQVQAMKTLVNEFRDYARLPAAQLKAIDLNGLVSEVLSLYTTQQEAGRLRFELAGELPLIEGDTTQLRQVIHNLVQNALDAVAEVPRGRVIVRTELARNEAGAVRAVRLVVADNGPGFSDSVLRRAFEPYVTTKPKGKGTGLGLAVVKKIADEHGARVRLTNLLGAQETDSEGPAVRGAQVSLSFSKFAAVGVAADSSKNHSGFPPSTAAAPPDARAP
jgi:nitrogen fixation/metabolism regulation signal transduction histidine kinase